MTKQELQEYFEDSIYDALVYAKFDEPAGNGTGYAVNFRDGDLPELIDNIIKAIETKYIPNKQKPIQEKNMLTKKFNMKSMMAKMFTQVDNVVMDITTGSLAISQGDDIYSLGADESITTGSLFTMPVPAFGTKISAEQINVGDILVHNQKAHGFVLSINEENKTVRVITPSGVASTMHIKSDLLTGSGWMIVKSMFGNIQSNPMLPMMLMMGDKEGEDSSSDMLYPMLMMSMMNQNGTSGGMGGMNPMMMAMMMSQGKDSDMSSMLPMMMMMGGNGGMNFFQPQQTQQAPEPQAVKRPRKVANP